jgi:hypothetical protein
MSVSAEQMQDQIESNEALEMDDEDLFAEEFDRRAGIAEAEPEVDPPIEQPDVEVQESEPSPTEQQVAPEAGTERPESSQAPQQPDPDILPDGSRIHRPEWYSQLPPEAQQHFDQTAREIHSLNWNYSSVHGRLAPVQRENERLSRQLANLEAQYRGQQPAADAQAGGQSAHAPPTAPTMDLSSSKEFAEFADSFPEEARAIEALFSHNNEQITNLSSQLQRMQTGLNQIQQTTDQRTTEEEMSALTTAHPDWMRVRESQQFNQWLSVQPQRVVEMVNSDRAEDCIWALDAFKSAAYLNNLAQQPQGPIETPAQRQAQVTRQHRSDLLNTPTPDPQGGRVGVPQGAPGLMSAEDIFAEEFDRRVRQQKQHIR